MHVRINLRNTMQQQPSRALTLMLAGLTMVGPFAIDAYLPTFFNIANDLQITTGMVQQTLSVYLFAYAIMALFHGTLSDTFGRRPVIFVSLIMFIAGSVGAMFAPSLGFLLVCRIIQGMSAGAGAIVGQAVVRDLFQGAVAQKMMANIMMVFGLAPAIAPVIGGYISTHASWRGVFAFLTGFALLVLLVSWKILPESLPVSQRQPLHLKTIIRNYMTALRHRYFLLGSLAFGCLFAGLALYIATAANFVMVILKLPETAFAWLFLPLISGMMIGSALISKFTGRIDSDRLLRIGFVVMGVGMVVNITYNSLFEAEIPWAVIPVFMYSFGMSLVMPAMMLKTLAHLPQMKGLASSLMNFMQMFLFAVVSGVVAPLVYESALHISIGVAVGVSLSAALWFLGANRAPATAK
jgi:DHA1 family bicyclomycin/chloramphenicol resistance-like MFS transporter